MPTWIIVALSVVFAIWSLIEVAGFHQLATRPGVSYTQGGARVTALWLVCLIFGGCYLVSRIFS
jgi:hypothetical protein